MATRKKAKLKKGDWVRLSEDRSEYGLVIGDFGKLSEGDDGAPFVDWLRAESRFAVSSDALEPWAPSVGERVRFVRDNSDGGASYGEKGEVVTVKKLWGGDRLDIEVNRFDWHPGAFMKDIEPVTGKAVDAPDAPKFKVGDRVRVTKQGTSGHGRSVGEEFTLSELLPGGIGGTFWRTSDGPDFYPDEIELTTPIKIEAGKFYMTRDGRKVGPMRKYDDNSWDENGGPRLYRDDGLRYFEFDRGPGDLIAEATAEATTAQTGTAIVCLIRDGKPLPASAPYVHDDERPASQEMRRLADLHKGDTFGVYRLTATCKQTKPTYDHEWQRLAASGERIMAIRALRRLTGLGLKAAKDAVEDWLRAA